MLLTSCSEQPNSIPEPPFLGLLPLCCLLQGLCFSSTDPHLLPLWYSHSWRYYSLALITSRPVPETRTNSMLQDLLKLFKLAILNLFTLLHLFLPTEKVNDLAHTSPSSLCLLTEADASCVALIVWHALSFWQLYQNVYSIAMFSQSVALTIPE